MLNETLDNSYIYCLIHAELRCLINDLRPVAAKWKTLGIELEVPMEDLKEIGARFTGEDGKAQACLQRVVDHWLENSTRPPTGEVLKKVLEAVGHRRQANELSEGLFLVELGHE